jgi:hypothetical protein
MDFNITRKRWIKLKLPFCTLSTSQQEVCGSGVEYSAFSTSVSFSGLYSWR